MRCAACGTENDAASRFCEGCGEPLAGPRADAGRLRPERAGPPHSRPPERRQLTALFCDLVGSTSLAQRLDPEELREVVTAYHESCSRSIGRFEGYIAQYLGDGVLAYFGYPRAHEDDAERAVRAALAMQDSLAELNRRRAERGAEKISARLGIHTGLVVVTDIGDAAHHETLALGDAISVASRLQELAEPGGVVISDATLRLVPGLFATRGIGRPALKGVSEPIGIHAVLGDAGAGARHAARPSTPLRGRDRELALFVERWERAREGRGQVLALSGEAGMGKSRLLFGFCQRLRGAPHLPLEITCSPYTVGSAFQPLVEALERGLDFSEHDDPEAKLEKLEERLGRLPALSLESVVPFLAPLLALSPSPRFPLPHMSPALQREKTLEAMVALMVALARWKPLLLACEDLHWSDPSTVELLGRLIDCAAAHPMLVVLTFRPDFEPPWQLSPSHVARIELSRLSGADIRAVAAAAAGDLPAPVLDQIVERADGVPLFAEELARSVVAADRVSEHDAGAHEAASAPLAVPPTLQASLMARLDRLHAAKPIAQLAANLGREFPYPLIEAIADVEVAELRSGLAQLVDAAILLEHGTPPATTYTFRHALLRDTAYESQLKRQRRALHARIANVLEEKFPQRVAAEPEVMARHCAEGGLFSRAVDHYQQAGEQALARVSNSEAVEYFGRALELLTRLPEDDARHQKEIALRLARGGPLAALRGYDDAEAVASCQRVEELCERLGSGPQQLGALVGLTLYHVNRGHLPRAREFAESLLRIAEPLGVAGLRVAGHMIRGTANITTASVPEACRDLERAIEIARTAGLPPPATAFDVDALTVAHSTYAIALAIAGRTDAAKRAAAEAVRRGRELSHPRTAGSALVNASMAFHLMEDVEATRALSGECLEVVAGRGFHSVECSARVQHGWARARLGDLAGIGAIEEGLDRACASGALGGLSQLYFTASEIYRLAGRLDRASAALERGEQISERTGERTGYGAQVCCIRARLLLESGAATPEQVEPLLLESIALWRRLCAPWMELQPAILLGRLALETGKTREARTRLCEAYAAFSEGFETPRLREAHALIEQLA